MIAPNIHCSYHKLVLVSELKPHPKNRNKHPKKQIERYAEILKYSGVRKPIRVSSRSGFITAGHGALLAAKINGWTEYPVDVQHYDSDEQEYADLNADNALALQAELDIEAIKLDIKEMPKLQINMLGIKGLEKVAEHTRTPREGEDDVPAEAETRAKLGQVWALGRHRLMCGSATQIGHVEALLADEVPDFVFTDPPYGIDVVQRGSDGASKPFGSQRGTVGAANGTVKRIIPAGEYRPIANDGSIDTAVEAFKICAALSVEIMLFWGANYYASSLPDRKKWIVWDKDTTGNFADCELAWTNLEGRVQRFRHTWNGLIKESERKERRVHPTQKPVALAEWCFETVAPSSQSVLDLFGGSGSTLIACEKTGRKCYMMELEPHYCDVIIARWEKFTGLKAELLDK